jgi:hypothetical protein
MLDLNVATLFEVPLKVLKREVLRNRFRFPDGSAFQLTLAETTLVARDGDPAFLRMRRFRNYRPYALDARAIALLAGALRSNRAIQIHNQLINVAISKLLSSEPGLRDGESGFAALMGLLHWAEQVPQTVNRLPQRAAGVRHRALAAR